MIQSWFTISPFYLKRWPTQPLQIGALKLGSGFPVRVQSMANTPTSNVEASVNQAIEIILAGGELIRFTVINSQDAEALKQIKEKLTVLGHSVPLVADVHFNPILADIAAKYVDKVRINPGNYLDKRASFKKVFYSDEEYAQELSKLEERFVSFLSICKEHHTAVRIGTNHGSLSDRIMSRYGDTPSGMVEATMEFLRICKKHGFTNVVVSLKSSNTRVMVHAYRLLALQMHREQMRFALHLGVTEAGNAEDGRIKSSVGIGTLMHDGLGDTIRVSLTEHPAKEIPVANLLISHFENLSKNQHSLKVNPCYDPYSYNKRFSFAVGKTGESNAPVVIADVSNELMLSEEIFLQLGFSFNVQTKTFERGDLSPDILFTGNLTIPRSLNIDVTLVSNSSDWFPDSVTFPLFTWDDYQQSDIKSSKQNWVLVSFFQLSEASVLKKIKEDTTAVLVVFSENDNYTQEIRACINILIENQITNPVIIKKEYPKFSLSDFQIISAADCGLFFIDGLADGLWIQAGDVPAQSVVETAFGILQASRTRTTKTEYISCPSCGRTLFDIEASLAKVKSTTQHLKGLKIAVMGCIVNGPGEMADADYGYVGAGPGKVSLYKGKELVLRNIDANSAVDELLALINQNQKSH
jgi:(E)-4-hydroxy-3-methylbut-2-enyl-diphosphate synthase